MSDTLTGKTIGKYQILNKLGSGGMAEVYKGYQDNLDRYVAIKFMHAFLADDQDFLHRFKREARAMASLRHPHIVRVFDFDTYGEATYYLVMEYIEGGTLKELLAATRQTGEPIPLEQARQIAAEMADALAYAHGRGMVHRDIKPGNIMLDAETGKAVLTDFGIVKLAGGQTTAAVTMTGALIGTPAYMSPEQALGEKGDTRVDIYSLGVVLFQMVTGQLPFDADTPLAVVMKQVNDPVPLPMNFNPDVPLNLQDVILKSLAKKPDDRYQTAAEMAAALRSVNLHDEAAAVVPPIVPPTAVTDTARSGATPGATVVVEPPAEIAAASSAKKRPAWLWAVAGVILLLLIGGGLFASGVFGSGTAPPPTSSAVIIADETDTPQPTETPMGMDNMPAATPNILATQVAELSADATRRAQPTDTPPPTKTPTASPTASPTPDATAQFLLTCRSDVELLSVKAENYRSNAVITNQKFNAEWALRNNGECPWPAGSQWVYVEGETFAYDGEPPVLIETVVNTSEEIILTAPFTAPAVAGTYKSVWQLQNPDGEIIGAPLKFEFRVFPPATATPAATNTPTAVPTSETVEGQADWIFTVDSCEYIGSDWRCQVTIIPYIDGSDATGQFTVFVFDQPAGQATTFRGTGPFIYFAQARRCAAFNQTVRVVDDVTATEVTEPLYIHPNDYFPGGCTEN